MASPDFILMVKSPERSVVVVVIFHESTTRQTRKPTLTGFSECEQKLCLSERLTDTATTFLQGMMENIQEVKLKKTLNGLGFSFFISELDTSLDCGSIVRIRTLFPGQPAEESGQIQEGDVILSINGQPLKGLSYQKTGPHTMQAPTASGSSASSIEISQSTPVHAAVTQQPTLQETLMEFRHTLQNYRPASVSPMAKPANYSGDGECKGFLLQCKLYMEVNAAQFNSEKAKIAFIISLLTGRALNWAQALWDSDAPALQSFDGFLNHFSTVFSQSSNAISVHDQLFRLRQGNSSVSDYALRFRTIAASSGWNEIALMTAYRQGLNSDICLQLAIYDDTIGIEKLIQRSILIAQHRTACFQNPSARPPRLSEPVNPPVPEPMEFDSGRLTTTERNRRRTNNLCFYCGASEHYRAECPVRPSRSAVSTVELPFPVSNLKQTPVLLTYRKHSVPAKALIDSGAAGNFISASLLNRLQARRRRLSRLLSIHSILGKPLSNRNILHCSPELQLSIGCLHQERCSLLVLEGSTSDIVLGRPWLNQHSPNICWTSGEIRQWSNYCKSHCLRPIKKNSTTPSLSTSPAILGSTSIESPATDVAPEIPPEYRAFQDVFSKQLATTLPPHRPWDCAIDLLPGATLPHGKVYPLSIPEQKAMEEYVEEALRQGYIRPSTSPAASSFFVGKKDGGLRPCIDYRILNAATVKYRYPLPLVPSALEQLRSAKIFTKLDLRSAYNLVRIREGDEWKTAFITPAGHYEYRVMPFGLSNSPAIFQGFMNEIFRDMLHRFVIIYIDDILIYSSNLDEHILQVKKVLQRLREYQLYLKLEKCEFHRESMHFLGYVIRPDGISIDQSKVEAVINWPKAQTLKELQRFLGFANFYRRFIRDYSKICVPVTSMVKKGIKRLTWSTEACQAFETLKEAFSSAPMLSHPDPELPFLVEVDASTNGVGAVLSQRQGTPSRLHPCAFFSRKLSPAEQNYDVGNRELLAIKLALEEWRHWLEGANHPFQVITDHRNLEYLREAKRLNPRQARWALFFTRFNFTVTYRPGSKNLKADALSRLYQPESSTEINETILPPTMIVSPIQWNIDELIADATVTEPAPPGGPEGKIFVPTTLRLPLMDSVHTSPGSGHPGSQQTLSLLQQRYWWPSMAQDTSRYVQGCTACAMTKVPRRLPEGKLMPLPLPNRPWSHLAVDFVTDLPSSDSKTCILVVVDRFSKSCKLISLSGLPTAFKTAEMLFTEIFRHFGIPEDIVSDRGPQFISRVWKSFFKLLGVSVSLTSGYHPQSNGQAERKIQEIGRYLRTYCHEAQDRWNQYLPWAEYAQNSLRQTSTGLTPFQCVLGYQPPLFPWTGEPSDVPAVQHWFTESERVWDSAHVHLQGAVRRFQQQADARRRATPHYTPGQLVWLSTRDIRLLLPSRKLSPRFIGPFAILRQVNEVTYRLALPRHYRIAPTFHVSLLKPYTAPLSPPSTEADAGEVPPPPPVDPTDEAVYQVHTILDSRRQGGQLQHLVDWEGFGPEERCWVHRDDILDPTLLQDFHREHPDRPAPRPRGRPRRRGIRPSGAGRGGGGTVTDPLSTPQPASTQHTWSRSHSTEF
ncbi:unnamed protein product [Leuciscus chuanchicus]